ncbi:MAG: hypothetical protein A4E66_02519 [Syntrophus sp. PtaB.Bin001]|nr:MAG: hypothetical protein A4E66_02519 [Syntrophus sp. PtaB.Bin001]
MAAGLQGFHKAQFLLGRHPGVHADFIHSIKQFLVAHFDQFPAGNHPIRIPKADPTGNGRGGKGMVSGNHLDVDSGAVTISDSFHRFSPGRVDHTLQSQKGHARRQILVGNLPFLLRKLHPGEGQYAQTPGGHCIYGLQNTAGIQFQRLPFRRNSQNASLQNGFHRTFCV